MKWEPPSIPTALLLGIVVTTSVPVLVSLLRQDPIISITPTIVNTPIAEGEDPIIQFDTYRRYVCRAESDNFIIKLPEYKVVYRARIQGISSRPGHQISQITLEMVKKLLPGDYVYRSYVYSDCDGRQSTYIEPDAPFTVVSRPPSHTNAGRRPSPRYKPAR